MRSTSFRTDVASRGRRTSIRTPIPSMSSVSMRAARTSAFVVIPTMRLAPAAGRPMDPVPGEEIGRLFERVLRRGRDHLFRHHFPDEHGLAPSLKRLQMGDGGRCEGGTVIPPLEDRNAPPSAA